MERILESEAGFSRLCARNLVPDLFGWSRSAR